MSRDPMYPEPPVSKKQWAGLIVSYRSYQRRMYAVLVTSAVVCAHACSLSPTQLMGAGYLQPQLVVGRCVTYACIQPGRRIQHQMELL